MESPTAIFSLDQIVHQLQRVLFVPEIAEGIVAIGLAEVDQIQHPDFIAFAFEVAAGGQQHLRFGVGDHIVGVGLQNVGQHIAPGLGGTAAADDQHVETAPMLAAVQSQADVAGEDFVLLLGELAVYLPGRVPGGGAVFLAVPGASTAGKVDSQPQYIEAGTNKNGRSALLRPTDF